MQEYSFLKEISAQWLGIFDTYTVRLVGKYAERLSCDDPTAKMSWANMNEFTNENLIRFEYKKRGPNQKWPWPFRNFVQPTVVVEGLELYTGNDLRFSIPMDGIPHYLAPGSSIELAPNSIKITI